MIYCKKCVMDDTCPERDFDENGVCQACRTEEKKKTTDWDTRKKEIEQLCAKYRSKNENDPIAL